LKDINKTNQINQSPFGGITSTEMKMEQINTKKKARQMLCEATHMINVRDLAKYTDFSIHKDGHDWWLRPGASSSPATSFTRQELLEILGIMAL
jgi:hypothetical protein